MGSTNGGAAPRRLLIVGDPALSRGLMKMVLSRLGYVVTCVVTGHEALAAFTHTQFALALVAVHLPDQPGLSLARRLRGAPGPVGAMPIILFGDAWDSEPVLRSCREARLDGYLPKPISIGRLVSSIRDLIHRAAPPPAGDPAVTPTPTPTPSIALAHFTSFTDGDPQLERELSSLYLATADLYLDEMRAAVAEGGGDWSRAAHALKGASGNIGAAEVARLAAEAEAASPDAERLAGLEAALEAVRHFFRGRLDATAPRPGALARQA
jgi:CheY-like chemotaxis protein/HPt (histidine-containing phosphotransfer) domain-containing protein